MQSLTFRTPDVNMAKYAVGFTQCYLRLIATELRRILG